MRGYANDGKQMGDEWTLGVGKPVGSEKNAATDLFRDMGVEPGG